MNKRTFSRPYAQALFNCAKAQGQMHAWGERIAKIAESACGAEAFLLGPRVSGEEKVGLLREVCPDLPEQIDALLTVMAENERLALWPEVASLYQALQLADAQTLQVLVQTPYALSEVIRVRLEQFLVKRYGQSIQWKEEIVLDLIGGIRICVGDQVMDCSLKSQLNRLHQQLVA